MKINVEVDLTDFFSEDDTQSFNDQILDHISHTVKNNLFHIFKDKGMSIVQAKVTEMFNEQFETEIQSTVKSMFDMKVVKDGLSYKQHIEDKLSKSLYYREDRDIEYQIKTRIGESESKITSELNSQAAKISKELKERYDLLFASQFVSKMNGLGMLKEDVAKLLLPEADA